MTTTRDGQEPPPSDEEDDSKQVLHSHHVRDWGQDNDNIFARRPGPEQERPPPSRRPGAEDDNPIVRPQPSSMKRPGAEPEDGVLRRPGAEDDNPIVRPQPSSLMNGPGTDPEKGMMRRPGGAEDGNPIVRPQPGSLMNGPVKDTEKGMMRRPGAEDGNPIVRPQPGSLKRHGAEPDNGILQHAHQFRRPEPVDHNTGGVRQRGRHEPEDTQESSFGIESSSLAPPVRRKISREGYNAYIKSLSSDDLVSIPEHVEVSPPRSIPKHVEASPSSDSSSAPLRMQQQPSSRRHVLRQQSSSISSSSSTSTRLLPGDVSLFQGQKAIRLSVVRTSNALQRGSSDASTVSFAPRRLIDIENGTSMVVTREEFLDSHRYQQVDESGALQIERVAPLARPDYYIQSVTSLEDKIRRGDVRDFKVNSEVGVTGGMWRGVLWRIMVQSRDSINGLQLSRGLQLFLPFLTGYESYVLAQVIQALEHDRKGDLQYTLSVAFQNRNVSRILVQTIGPRYDFVWHWNTQITHNRVFDAWGQFPVVGFTGFPATENFPSTKDHALASIFRNVLGPGNWITRVVTGREGLITDDPNATAQNLAAESNGFELANRNQYGTYVGRQKTNEFRFAHRLPTDESIVRTFVAQPMPTMVNNGVVHVLRQLAKHWHNMLWQPSGNFAHQRMEQLNPFETLRFHMPVVLLTLSSLRGRNRWDSEVLGPFVKRLQELKPNVSAEPALYLISELQEMIVTNVSGGVFLIMEPFYSWLDALQKSCYMVEEEAKQVYDVVTAVEIGIRLGHDLITQISWKIPTDAELKQALLQHIRGEPTGDISEKCIHSAMSLITPRDKRTLVELVQCGLGSSRPAQLLLGRAKTLLQRQLRREILNQSIQALSKGDEVTELQHDEWYWLEFENGPSGVYIYDAKVTGRDAHRFVHVDTKFEKFVSFSTVKIRTHVPVAEAISRAQRAFMNIELDHGKKFGLDAFMEFTFLRTALRRLAVISQVTCEELDNARLNMLAEIQRSNQAQVSMHNLVPGKTYYSYDSKRKEYVPFVYRKKHVATDPEWKRLAQTKIVKVPPQSMIVVGGGPTGLMTVIHCTEEVLHSGGEMKLYEARDAFAKGGSTFERAQIVRLDARWISMLRFHLGTGFEDVYIPASGETDSQLGNTLPTQAFVEITIKDLENMLHVEVAKMWSKGLLTVYSDSKSTYDPKTNSLAKLGTHLKMKDAILRRVNEEGRRSNDYHSWRVVEVERANSLGLEELKLGEAYGIYVRAEDDVLPYVLTGIDLQTQIYTFVSLQEGSPDIKANAASMPYVYHKGTSKHAEVRRLVIESVKKGSKGGYAREIMFMKDIKDMSFTLDVGHTHVVEAIGKPNDSKVHFSVTTYEPYGVCCIQGLKISMGMHNFGEKRWGMGLLDDLRSVSDFNTRIVGDFTKMVRSAPVTQKMKEYMADDRNWQIHFEKLAVAGGFPELNDLDPIVPHIQQACFSLAEAAPTFRRQTLQTRFFETGDNYYLGMEFMREYDKWKKELATALVLPLTLKAKDGATEKNIGRLKGTFMHHIDRLWYDAVLEVIRTGDVYNPGARRRVPRLYLIDSYIDEELGNFPVGESFRLSETPKEKYEVVIKERSQVVVRSVEGYISKMPTSTIVRRESNLTRGPDGNAESKVALATFPVGHYVNFRSCRLNNIEKGYVFAFIGDEQATPHFMRYSGLTGACINAMLFNNFLKQANGGVPFIDRFRLYSMETNWSNGEVVQRGTGSNYGEDGFLRPGFSYEHVMDYLHSKVIEYWESGQDLNHVVSRDWKVKLAASLVPRGTEMNEEFMRSLREQLRQSVFNKFVQEAKADVLIGSDALESALTARGDAMTDQRLALDSKSYWNEFLVGLDIDSENKNVLEDLHVFVAERLDHICEQVVESATKAYSYNERISSELFNQPKSVDSILDDFAVEAQNFANSLTQSAAFAAGALAFTLVGDHVANIFGAILGGINIAVSFGTMTNSARYKTRNEEARIIFIDEKMLRVLKGVFSLMSREQQGAVPVTENPFVVDLKQKVSIFLNDINYYDCDSTDFLTSYQHVIEKINDPKEVLYFQHILVSKYLSDEFQVNSYLQEDLVNINKTAEELYRLLADPKSQSNPQASELFKELTQFHDGVEESLQRGPTRFGFLKKRRFAHWDCIVAFRYFYSLFCCVTSTGEVTPLAPTSVRTLGLVKQAQQVSISGSSPTLARECRDLEGFYWATRESDIASLIFVTGVAIFITSILFTIARIFRIQPLLDVTFWASLVSAFGAILATFHLWRKFWILIKLVSTLGSKSKTCLSSDDRYNIGKVRRVTWTQVALTVARFVAAATAAVALPWSVAENAYGDRIKAHADAPFWLALASVCAAAASTVFFFIVEYEVRYNLSPKLGEFVCESFREEIETIYLAMNIPRNDIDTNEVQERDTWEYVAREFLHRYRFDTVFAADRFGYILQYIQGGMDPRE